VKVSVDHDICAGFGLCNDALPEVFELDDLGFSVPRGDGSVPAQLEAGAAEAIAACPTHAIFSERDPAPS
jgi:ferredoxin